ncbi:hypothetical protein AKJ09_07333 [Labilithrix luteola]|uniref:Uncharacterized protein n=1 Tax=Labilithrix luteola TaxID=1391654 RepID=A0A0K1Q5J3_9BACT|nr:hypothetical protein AKJ09_07333 [Labilithrix luteola]
MRLSPRLGGTGRGSRALGIWDRSSRHDEPRRSPGSLFAPERIFSDANVVRTQLRRSLSERRSGPIS